MTIALRVRRRPSHAGVRTAREREVLPQFLAGYRFFVEALIAHYYGAIMNILVTGAAGFIASNFLYYVRETHPDWNIVALDALTYAGNLANISPLLTTTQVRFVKCDICDESLVGRVFQEGAFEGVFHFAAESHVDRSIHSANEFVRTNVLGTQVLLNAARGHGVKRFVHVSTDEVYGSLGETGYFYETTPLNPTSPYAASKAAADLMVLAAVKTHGLDAVVTRCTNNYGPYQFPEKFIPLFVTNALEDKPQPLYGDGLNVRSWLFVRDHCRALVLAYQRGRSREAYNIGSGPDGEIPNIDVSRTILAILRKPETLLQRVADRPAHDRRYAVDFAKAQRELGWSPQVGFQEGIASTVDWYVQNQPWWREIKSGEYIRFYEKNYKAR